MNGKIILLNGTSSAGKSSIAKKLHKLLDEPYLYMAFDDFNGKLPEQYYGIDPSQDEPAYQGFKWILPVSDETKAQIKRRIHVDPPSVLETILQYKQAIEELGVSDEILKKGVRIESGSAFKRLMAGVHETIAAFALQGNSIIFDHVLLEQEWLLDCLRLLEGVEVLFVGIRCPIEVVEQRERNRSNRFLGQARGHFDIVHAHGIYDLEVDTSVLTPEEAALRIAERAKNGPPGDAFDRLRARLK